MKRVILVVLSLMLILTACGTKEPNKTTDVNENKPIVLGFSQLGAESDWRMANTESIKSSAAEAGIELRFAEAEQKQENQINAIRQFITEKVDVIAFSPVITTGWDEVLKEARAAGIPVLLVDRTIETSDDSLYTSWIGSDFTEEGRKAGKWLVEKTKDNNGTINIVELEGTTGSGAAIGRQIGFKEIIKDYPNMKVLESKTGDFTVSLGKEVMKEFLQKYGDTIDVLYAHNDGMAAGAIEAIEEFGLKPGEDILVIGVDATKVAFEAMVAGKMNVTVECNPLMGPQIMQMVKDIKDGKTLQKTIYTNETIYPQEVAKEELPKRKY